MMTRLSFLFRLVAAFLALEGNASAADDTAWSVLKSGVGIIFIRHAVTDPGIGDPDGFVLGDCRTQRNLSAQGRVDAKAIGEVFRSRNIRVSNVLSSRWCRCLDTATLAFGKAKPSAMLDSMFNDTKKPAEEKIREVHDFVAQRPASGNLVFVTHAQNIQALTSISPAPAEMVVATYNDEKFKVVGRIDLLRH